MSVHDKEQVSWVGKGLGGVAVGWKHGELVLFFNSPQAIHFPYFLRIAPFGLSLISLILSIIMN